MTDAPAGHEEFVRRLRDRARASAYGVRAGDGFVDMYPDDPDFRSRFDAGRTTEIFTYRIAFPGPSTFSITDRVLSATWSQHGPDLAAARSLRVGRFVEKRTELRVVPGPDGHPGAATVHFDSTDGHRIIRSIAEELGYDERMGGATRLGLIIAGATIGGIALMAIIAVTLKLLLS